MLRGVYNDWKNKEGEILHVKVIKVAPLYFKSKTTEVTLEFLETSRPFKYKLYFEESEDGNKEG